MAELTFRCPSYSKAEQMRAWLNRRGIRSRQEEECVRITVKDGTERAIAYQGGERYGAMLIRFDVDEEYEQ